MLPRSMAREERCGAQPFPVGERDRADAPQDLTIPVKNDPLRSRNEPGSAVVAKADRVVGEAGARCTGFRCTSHSRVGASEAACCARVASGSASSRRRPKVVKILCQNNLPASSRPATPPSST